MKRVGFIDYYLDEWHANNYPEMFRKYAGSCEVVCAYGKIDSPLPGGINTREWGEKYGIAIADSIEEVIERSDCLVVLSPDNPECLPSLPSIYPEDIPLYPNFCPVYIPYP